jgi:branched-chain amino acid transport system ATP-binding protein
MSILQILDLESGYGDICVLNKLNMSVNKGEVVALIGSNGAGKTTLLRTISGLNQATSGEIILNGIRIDRLLPHEVVELGFVMVPEGRQLFTQMTVDENLMVGAHGTRARKMQNETIDMVYELFPRLHERRDQQSGSLSGGEQQMLAVGRALMVKPSVLALDEPSLGLAPIVVDHVFDVVDKIKKTGMTILLIEQNVQQTLELADRAYVIENGKITMEDTGDELLRNDYLKTTYMGI